MEGILHDPAYLMGSSCLLQVTVLSSCEFLRDSLQ